MRSTATKTSNDPVTRRRHYLKRLLAIRASMTFWGLLGGISCFLLLVCGMALVVFWAHNFELASIAWRVILCGGACACIVVLSYRRLDRTQERAASIPYVPPVREQIDALPSEEVLVRGSEKPAVTNSQLLRPSCNIGTTARTDLLRASESDTR